LLFSPPEGAALLPTNRFACKCITSSSHSPLPRGSCISPCFGVWGLGNGIWGLGFWVSCFGLRVSGFVFRVPGSRSRVSGFRSRVSGVGFRVSGFGSRVAGSRSLVSGFRVRHNGEYSLIEVQPQHSSRNPKHETRSTRPETRNGTICWPGRRLPSATPGICVCSARTCLGFDGDLASTPVSLYLASTPVSLS